MYMSMENLKITEVEVENGKWKKAVSPLIDQYIEKMQQKGLPGKQYVADLKRLIKEQK